jgi:Ni/Co efflux regulator RcnB
MNKFATGLLLSGLMLGLPLMSSAQHPDDHHDDNRPAPHAYVRHDDWKKGSHIQKEDWNRGAQVDYRTYHLKTPPRGYEWREVDGNYVLAAAATGVIASVIVASTIH